jgi:serine/threonine protein kinase
VESFLLEAGGPGPSVGPTLVIIMEMAPGGSIAKAMQPSCGSGRPGRGAFTPLPERLAAAYTFQIASALEYLHNNRPPIIHR